MTSAVILPAGKQVQSSLEIGLAQFVCVCVRVYASVCECVRVCALRSAVEWGSKGDGEKGAGMREKGRDCILSFAVLASLSPLFHSSHSTCKECSLYASWILTVSLGKGVFFFLTHILSCTDPMWDTWGLYYISEFLISKRSWPFLYHRKVWEFVLCPSIFDPQSPVCLTSIVSVYDVWTQLIVLSPGPLDEVDSGHIQGVQNY